MPYLDAIETEFNQRFNSLATPIWSRVRPDRDRTGGMRQLDCFANIETLFGNETGPACAEISVERLA
jgi:hypothetical protein